MTIQDYSAIKDFNSTLENRDGLFFLQAEIAAVPKGTKPQTHNTQQGQIGATAPTTTLAPQGNADTGYARDYWQFNAKGELVSAHRQCRKTTDGGKARAGIEYTSSHAQHFTHQSKHMPGQTSSDLHLGDQGTTSKRGGQHKGLGQAGQTSRNIMSFLHHSGQMMRNSSKAQKQK